MAKRCAARHLPFAMAAVEGASSLGQALTGKAARAFWDEGLMTAMLQHELSIAEEALAGSLLKDLGGRIVIGFAVLF